METGKIIFENESDFMPSEKQMLCKICGKSKTTSFYAVGVICGDCSRLSISSDNSKVNAALIKENRRLKIALKNLEDEAARVVDGADGKFVHLGRAVEKAQQVLGAVLENGKKNTTSRQRKWQEKKRAEGLCVLCGERAVTKEHCQRCRVKVNQLVLKRYHRNKTLRTSREGVETMSKIKSP